jgi:hypothetical protein
MSKDNGGPAFPQTTTQSYGGIPSTDVEGGMTLRQWYAGQALMGMIAGSQGLNITLEQFSQQSFALADLMIAEGNKP